METRVENKTEIISSRDGVVFLIDDNPIYLSILEEEILKLMPNVSVFLFDCGEKALKKMDLDPFLVFLDYDLGGDPDKIMNGINVLKKIKAQNNETEVVMLSGANDVNIITTSIKQGAYDFIYKSEKSMDDVKHKTKAILRKLRLKEERNDLSETKLYLKWVAILLVAVCTMGIYFYEEL